MGTILWSGIRRCGPRINLYDDVKKTVLEDYHIQKNTFPITMYEKTQLGKSITLDKDSL